MPTEHYADCRWDLPKNVSLPVCLIVAILMYFPLAMAPSIAMEMLWGIDTEAMYLLLALSLPPTLFIAVLISWGVGLIAGGAWFKFKKRKKIKNRK